LFAEDADRGWRAFIEQYTPVLLGLIARAGIRDKDEAMEIYTLACERLAENDCARIRRRDPGQGSIAGWLAVVLRHVAIDWIRSRAGRRRIFAAVKHLAPFDQRVFELYYWQDRMPTEIAEMLKLPSGRAAGLPAVLEALERVQQTLTDRQRGELVSLGMRSRAPVPLDADPGERAVDPPADRPDPEAAARIAELNALLAEALSDLPAEDVAILRLKYVHGLTHREIARALRLEQLTDERVRTARDRLRSAFGRRGAAGVETTASDLTFLEGES